jgi:hypothetical protein
LSARLPPDGHPGSRDSDRWGAGAGSRAPPSWVNVTDGPTACPPRHVLHLLNVVDGGTAKTTGRPPTSRRPGR